MVRIPAVPLPGYPSFRLGLPTVAVYQTDLPAYARAYRLGWPGEALAWRWLRSVQNGAARTLAPSTVTATGLLAQGINDVWLWGRGVDTVRFDPARRSFHYLLAAAGYPVGDGPDPEPASPSPTRLAELGWMATKGTTWLFRRSRDLVPALTALALREWLVAENPPERDIAPETATT